METINLSDLAKAIKRQYKRMPPSFADGYARVCYEDTDPSCYEALQCWIDGKPLPDVQHGDMSISRILKIRCDGDELHAILLMSEYIRDPKVGYAKIIDSRN